MKKLLFLGFNPLTEFLMMVILIATFFLVGTADLAYAGVAGYNDDTYKGAFSRVKCANGVECLKDGAALKIRVNSLKTAVTFTSGDATPSVSTGTFFKSYLNNAVTITDFDDAFDGQEITLYSQGAVTLDVTSSGIKCGTTDIVMVSGDITKLLYDGTDWRCTSYIDSSDNLN